MKAEVIGWVATAVGAPIVAVTLCWTLVIFHYHRHSWVSADLLLVALLGEGLVKQGATFAYTLLTLLRRLEEDETWCSVVVWLVTSVHVLQAATLATLSASRLLALRSPLKHRKATRRTHLVYHLVSLSVLSSCIGVAAVLAEGDDHRPSQLFPDSNITRRCTFLPHQMDRRYALLSLALHTFLDVASLLALVGTLFSWCCLYRRRLKSSMSVSQPSTITADQKRQLLTSSSDLSAMSEISLTSASQNGGSVSKGIQSRALLAANLRYLDSEGGVGKLLHSFSHPPPPKTTSLDALPTVKSSASDGKPATPLGTTDTYKSCAIIGKPLLPYDDATYDRNYPAAAMMGARDGAGAEDGCRWTSESSYISTSTSSTNSRAPCIVRQQIREEDSVILGPEDLRLPSVVSILLLCYLVNHLPVLLVTGLGMFAPWLLPRVWSLSALVLWAGLAEEFLLPILLALSDRNFTAWVANIYTCSSRRTADLARHHQGLDGKFRVFNTQSLPQVCSQDNGSRTQQSAHQQQPAASHYQHETVKFPITNGSLFTSVDGRLPIIHNYRRGKGMRTNGAIPSHCVGVGLSSAQTRRAEVLQTLLQLNNPQHRSSSQQDITQEQHKLSYAPSVLETIETKVKKQINHNSRQQNTNTNMLMSDFAIQDLSLEQQSSDGEDDFNSEDLEEYNVDDDEPIYATLSSRSCCSATTAANDDFEFYQNDEKKPKSVRNSITDDIIPSTEKPFSCDQLVHRYQRRDGLKHSSQAWHCADWTVDKNNEVLKLVLPLIQAYQQQSDAEQEKHNVSEILKTVIENELKCEKTRDTKSESRQSNVPREEDVESSCDSLVLSPSRKQYQQHRRSKRKQSSMAGSLSLNNLDELLEEGGNIHRTTAAGEHSSSEEREMVFELPVKSESVLSLYRLPLDGGKAGAMQANTNCHIYKQIPPSQLTPLGRHLRQQTPLRRKKLPVPVLSVESLTTALSNAEVSYLDNGDLCRHGSVPDLKRVFVSDYI